MRKGKAGGGVYLGVWVFCGGLSLAGIGAGFIRHGLHFPGIPALALALYFGLGALTAYAYIENRTFLAHGLFAGLNAVVLGGLFLVPAYQGSSLIAVLSDLAGDWPLTLLAFVIGFPVLGPLIMLWWLVLSRSGVLAWRRVDADESAASDTRSLSISGMSGDIFMGIWLFFGWLGLAAWVFAFLFEGVEALWSSYAVLTAFLWLGVLTTYYYFLNRVPLAHILFAILNTAALTTIALYGFAPAYFDPYAMEAPLPVALIPLVILWWFVLRRWKRHNHWMEREGFG